MKKITRLALLIIAILGMNCAKAQTDFSIHAGLASPLGSFADSRASKGQMAWNTKTDRAGAGLGFDAGMKFRFKIPFVKGLGVIVTADLFYNGPNSDVKDWKEDLLDEALEESSEISDAEITIPKYINIPIMVGVNYEQNIAKDIKLWGEGALGANIGMITDFNQWALYYDEEEYIMNYSFNSNTSLAYQIGAGVMFAKKFSLGIHYYAFGSKKVKGEMNAESITGSGVHTDSERFTLKSINPSLFVIRAGYHF